MTGATVTSGRGVLSRADALRLAAHLPDFREQRYLKYFVDAPAGLPLVAVAHDESSRAVGMGALHRCRLLVEGRPEPIAVAGDFVVEPAHRTLGLALRIQRSLLELAEADGVGLVLGEPNDSARGIFSRLGYETLAQRHSYVRFFGRGWAAPRTRHRVAFAGVRAVDVALGAVGPERWLRRRGTGWVDRFDDRFDAVLAVAGARGVVRERTPELLDWRYELDSSNGTGRFAVLAYMRRDVVRAYVVVARTPRIWYAKEIVGVDAPSLGIVVAEALARARSAGAAGFVFSSFARSDALSRALMSLQFVRRPTPRWLFARGITGPVPDWAQDAQGWNLSLGDLDP